MREVDVLVVGLGPVGAVLAGLLGGHGIDTLVAERDAGPYALPRAVACDDEALRVLAGLPGGADVLAHVNGHQRATFVDARGRRLVEIDFGETELGLPGLAFFHQPTVERLLRAGLATLPSVGVELGSALTGVRQDSERVAATLRGREGAVEEVRAGWLVGCDGAASDVRRALGVPFAGRTLPSRWLVVDVVADPPLADRPYLTYTCDPARPSVDMPVPGGHRFEWAVLPGECEEELARPATVGALLASRVDPDRVEVVRATVYAFHARVARRWRIDRVLLAGDAAHCMPPFAGQGLGAGVRDAANLAWKLAAVVRGEAGTRLLDSYERERRPHLSAMTLLSRFVGAVLDARDPTLVAVRDRVLPAVAATPALGPWLRRGGPRPRPALPRGSAPWLAARRGGRGGAMLPRPPVRDLAGRVTHLDGWLGHGHALLGLGVDPLAGAGPATAGFWARRGAAVLAVVPPGGRRGLAVGVPALEDLDGALLRVLRGGGPGAVAVVRPDRHLAGLLRAGELAEATRAYATWLDAPD